MYDSFYIEIGMKTLLSCLLLCFCNLENVTGTELYMTTSDFVHLVDSPFFVDKTELIRILVIEKKHLYLSGPDGFGKSSAMSMVKTFLEIQPDPMTGVLRNVTETRNYKTFSKQPRFLKHPLSVYTSENFFHQNFGRYPVVYFNFSEIAIRGETELFVSLRLLVRQAIFQHQYLWGSKVLKDDEKMKLRNFVYAKETPEPQTLEMMTVLFSHLYRVYNQHTVVLIDDFDAPVLKYITSQEITVSLAHLMQRVGQFIQALIKGNRNVAFSFMTGVTSCSEIYSSFVENIEHVSIFSSHYAQFFGYTQYEVHDIAERHSKKNLLNEFMDWYDRYNVEGSGIRLYNSITVTHYFFYGGFQPYWTQHENTHFYKKFFRLGLVGERIWKAIRDFPVNLPSESLRRKLHTDDVNKLQRLFEIEVVDRKNYRKGHEYVLLRFMMEKGYFTSVNAESTRGPQGYIKSPNREIRTVLAELLFETVAEEHGITREEAQNYTQSLTTLKNFTQESCLRYIHQAEKLRKHCLNPVRYVYLMAFSIALITSPININNTWIEFNQPEGGRDRNSIIDCAAVSKNDPVVDGETFTAYIVNLEIANTTSAFEALQAIYTKGYHKYCYSDNIKKCIMIGLHDEGETLGASILMHEGSDEIKLSHAINVTSSTPVSYDENK